ncbi:mannose-1-phosphate guanylyltransferase/mannose-6-phosphate isomerase [Pelomicrobium sp.]|jgi:mannose-1-phosphate guanylyltransferase/mannose-6-phosphate isomerase|uniref:mannose-1-phosphate guanylyltransferase/mannose-6-phosphate isomerase n=1 Tax=Pelomicrobium sp. TaxID=2815319 RepID=UPI002FDF04D9
MDIYAVVLSGGAGTRLWPMSRETLPKQFLRLTSEHSLLQETLLRLEGLAGLRATVVVANQEHRFLVAEHLRGIGLKPEALILEPAARNTAPAIAVAALHLTRQDPKALMLVLPADHHIPDAAALREAICAAVPAAQAGHLVTFGVTPRWAETGYGYIERGEPLGEGAAGYRVARFLEKPDEETAARFQASGRHYWNSGMFLFRAEDVLTELRRLKPALVGACEEALAKAGKDLDFLRLDAEAFGRSPSVSIDYALMEHTARAAVLPVDFSWTDLGSWKALWEVGVKDVAGNVTRGDVHLDGAKNSYVYAERRFVAALGVEDLVIVETPDAVLVARRDEVQKVRQVVEDLRARNRHEHVTHRTVYRPWGCYESIDAGHRFQVKRITVNPGQKLSLQMHHHRAEHWVVVVGTAKVTRGDETLVLTENQSTYIPLGVTHRLENPGKIPLQLIEVQSGAYLGEDDIVRFEDAYSRVESPPSSADR